VPKIVAIHPAKRPKSVLLSAGRVILEKYTANLARPAKIVAEELRPSGLRQKLAKSFYLLSAPHSTTGARSKMEIFALFQGP
jgi:hypothetical protein